MNTHSLRHAWVWCTLMTVKFSYHTFVLSHTNTDSHATLYTYTQKHHISGVHLDLAEGCLHKSPLISGLECTQIYDRGFWLKYVTLSSGDGHTRPDTHTHKHVCGHTYTHSMHRQKPAWDETATSKSCKPKCWCHRINCIVEAAISKATYKDCAGFIVLMFYFQCWAGFLKNVFNYSFFIY